MDDAAGDAGGDAGGAAKKPAEKGDKEYQNAMVMPDAKDYSTSSFFA